MSSKSVRRGRFSATTIVLILVLLGAVAGASLLVVPPAPGPPQPIKQDAVANAAKERTMMQSEQKKQQEMKEKFMNAGASIPRVEDPNTIEVTNRYFLDHKPGDAGLKQNDEELRKRKVEYAAYLVKVAEARRKGGNVANKPHLIRHAEHAPQDTAK